MTNEQIKDLILESKELIDMDKKMIARLQNQLKRHKHKLEMLELKLAGHTVSMSRNLIRNELQHSASCRKCSEIKMLKPQATVIMFGPHGKDGV